MSKVRDEFSVSLSVGDAERACRSAIAGIGWNIASVEECRIVLKIGFGVTRNPSRIEVLLRSAAQTETVITINGSIIGVGPLQKGHLTRRVRMLRNAIEFALSATGNASD